MMLPVFLPTLLFTLSALSTYIPQNPTLTQSSSQNSTSLTVRPWPSTPYVFPVEKDAVYPLYMTIKSYGSPGPTSTVIARRVLSALQIKLFNGGESEQIIKNLTVSVPGAKCTFTSVGDLGSGISRLQALTILVRLREFTATYGAVGVEDSELEIYGDLRERFELVWMFE